MRTGVSSTLRVPADRRDDRLGAAGLAAYGGWKFSIPDLRRIGYTERVNKTTLEFDPAKRDAVAAVLGTKGLKATVDAAFDAVLRQHAGRELVRLVQEGGIELTNEEVESQAWRD